MIQKHEITLLGMALLVAFSSFAARAYAVDVPETSTVDQRDCARAGGWLEKDIAVCESEEP